MLIVAMTKSGGLGLTISGPVDLSVATAGATEAFKVVCVVVILMVVLSAVEASIMGD